MHISVLVDTGWYRYRKIWNWTILECGCFGVLDITRRHFILYTLWQCLNTTSPDLVYPLPLEGGIDVYVAAALLLACEVLLKSLTRDALTFFFSVFFQHAENIPVDCLCSHHCRLSETIAVWGKQMYFSYTACPKPVTGNDLLGSLYSQLSWTKVFQLSSDASLRASSI